MFLRGSYFNNDMNNLTLYEVINEYDGGESSETIMVTSSDASDAV